MTFEMITPQGLVTNQTVDSVTAPGANGQFQVLKGHANFISKLDIGIVKIESDTTVDYFTCNGGVFEIDNDNVKILTESAENYKDIDIERADNAKNRAEKRLSERDTQVDISRADVALSRALNRHKASLLK